jgi:diaminohydroxyphosphoribosylaminopyrimidine deaminase/5-amino-6-(5-phosphoribosylamino)uracil reductase
MRRALELARRGLYTADPNPRVGCVLVNAGAIVGEGWHARAGQPHAERIALDHAGATARGATAYVTLEPCNHTGRTGPCAAALVAAGVARVVCAIRDSNPAVAGGGLEALAQAGVEVQSGLLAGDAQADQLSYLHRTLFQLVLVGVRPHRETTLHRRCGLEQFGLPQLLHALHL